MKHDDLVRAFFQKAREQDPKRYNEICKKYPTLSTEQLKDIYENEECDGLIGLQPARIPIDTAVRNGVESIYEEKDS